METRTTSASPAREPGRLTAMMRAAHIPSLPRVLRVGLVSGGKVIHEHACDAFPVTLGGDEGANLVIRGMRGRHTLFAMKDGVLSLCLLPGMSGRMMSEVGLSELGSLARESARVPVSTHARGRIDFAGTRILFQFVERPIPSATPRLPLAVKAGPQIDWTLAMICAMSFLLHFGFLGAMYSDWADPIVRDDLMVGALVDMERRLTPQTQAIEVRDELQTPATPDAKRTDAQKPSPRATTSNQTAQNGGQPASSSKSDPSLMASADAMMMSILTAQSDNAPSTQLALRRSEIPAIDLGKADGNVRPDNSDLTFHSQVPIAPGQKHDLSTLGDTHATATNTTPGQPRDVAVPFTMDLPPTVSTVRVSNADRVIAELRPKFRKCYTDGLAKDASQQGALTVRVKIAPTGEVAGVTIQSNTGLSAEVAACVSKRLQNAQFDAPGGTGSNLDVPVKFVHQ